MKVTIVKMKLHYNDGREMMLGDEINYNSQKGRIVAVGPRDEFDAKFPKNEWESVGDGYLIEFTNGALLRSDDPADDENLELIARQRRVSD